MYIVKLPAKEELQTHRNMHSHPQHPQNCTKGICPYDTEWTLLHAAQSCVTHVCFLACPLTSDKQGRAHHWCINSQPKASFNKNEVQHLLAGKPWVDNHATISNPGDIPESQFRTIRCGIEALFMTKQIEILGTIQLWSNADTCVPTNAWQPCLHW